ncbi:MAG: 50S ribosomal protein L23 [Clostridia bacterium]|nr:50S ribosomal protein L23 [Clostridia bacterium]MDY6184169.1 50S ribosomal protein L23 [Eubacteriales bacterium]
MKSVADVIVRPLITEKCMDAIGRKCYGFEVAKEATKPEIAKAVEEMFGVKVAEVCTLNVKKKPKRVGYHAGYTSEWKKAIVTLTEDSKTIAFFDSLN